MAIWRAALESWRSGFVNHSLNSHAAVMAKAKISAAAMGSTVLSTLPASATCTRLVVTRTVYSPPEVLRPTSSCAEPESRGGFRVCTKPPVVRHFLRMATAVETIISLLAESESSVSCRLQ